MLKNLKWFMLWWLLSLSVLTSLFTWVFAESYDNLIYDVDINYNCWPTECMSWEDDQWETYYDCMDFHCMANLPNSAYWMSPDHIEVYTILNRFLNISYDDFWDYKVCMNWKSLQTEWIKWLYQSYNSNLVPALTSWFPIVWTSYCTELDWIDGIYIDGWFREATWPSMFFSWVENIKIYSNDNHFSTDVTYELTDVSAWFRIPLGWLKPSSVDIQIVDWWPISFNYSYSERRYPTINSSCSLINQKYVCNDSDYLNFVYWFQPAFDLVINSVWSESNKILVTVKWVQRQTEESITSSIVNSNSWQSWFWVAVVTDSNSFFDTISKILWNYTDSIVEWLPYIILVLLLVLAVIELFKLIKRYTLNIFTWEIRDPNKAYKAWKDDFVKNNDVNNIIGSNKLSIEDRICLWEERDEDLISQELWYNTDDQLDDLYYGRWGAFDPWYYDTNYWIRYYTNAQRYHDDLEDFERRVWEQRYLDWNDMSTEEKRKAFAKYKASYLRTWHSINDKDF